MNSSQKEFVLPLCDKDLFSRDSKQTNQYIVTNITPTAEIARKIKIVSNSVMGECSHLKPKELISAYVGPFVFAKNFDLFFCCLRDIEKVNAATHGIAWDCTLQTLCKCVNVLSKLPDSFRWEEEERSAVRQVVKMSFFILVRMLEFYEDRVKSVDALSLALAVPTKKRKKNAAVTMASNEAEIDKEDWAVERERALQLLADMISCNNLSSLWASNTSTSSATSCASVEDSLINWLIKAVCVCLASADLSASKSTSDSSSRNSIARLCSKVISTNPNQLPVLASKMIYLLRNNEKSLTCILELSIGLAETYQHSKFIFEILREIGSCDAAEFCQDSESTKTLTSFLVQLSGRLPNLFFKWFFFLVPHFQEESYSFRMALCTISGEVLQYAFQASASAQNDNPQRAENASTAGAIQQEESQAPEEFTEQQKKSRDELFEELQLHVHDVHANVRSRAMATLTHLLEKGLIPLNSAVELLLFVAPSVHDVASSVRRNCIQLLVNFIVVYPYAFKYQRHDFETLLKEEKMTLQEIMKASNKQSQQVHLMTREEAEKKWDTMSEKLVKHLVRAVSETANKKRQPNKRKQLAEDEDEENGKDETKEEEKTEKSEDEKDEEEEEEMETNEDDKLSMLLGKVRSNLDSGEFREAILGIEKALNDHPTCPLFMAAATNPTLTQNEDDEEDEDDERRSRNQCHSSISGKKRVVMLHDLMKAVYIAPFAKLSVNSHEAADKMLTDRNLRRRSQVAAGGEGAASSAADNGSNSSSARELAELLQTLPSMSAEQIEDLIRTQKNKIILIQKCVKIQKVFHKQVLPACWNLLGSSTPSDVTTAIEFLVVCVQFGLHIGCGIQKLLSLLACPDAAIRAAVVSAFQRIYFTQSVRTQEVAQNLLALAKEDSCGETYSDWLSLQSLVSEFVRLKHMNEKVINYFWEVITLKHCQVHTEQDRLLSVALLGMAAKEEPGIITTNLNVLIRYTLTPNTPQNDHDNDETATTQKFNFFLANEALKALLVTRQSEEYERLDDSLRIAESHYLVNCLSTLLCTGMRHVSNAGWIEFAGSAVETIFTLVKDPLAVMGRLLDECHPETQVENSTNQDANTLWANEVAEEIGNKSDVNEEIVRRFVCLLGHVAQNTAVFLEMNVFNEVQFHKRKREQEKEAKKASRRAAAVSAGGKGTSDGGSNLNTSRMSGMRRGAASATNARQSVTHSVASTTLSNTEGESTPCGLSNNVMNECGDIIKAVCDDNIVTGTGLLAKFVNFVKSCLLPVGAQKRKTTSSAGALSFPLTSHPSAALRASATITLAKFMLTSEVICRENLQLLFTIMEKDPDAVIRSNVISLTADLLIRFPNAVAPWTPNIYARLQDTCDDVRLNCVITVAQLVLKEQIKVKGQISEMAKCILDANPKIASHAKRLFEDLAKKNNTLYNVLADIISRLSGHSADCHDDAEKQVIDEELIDGEIGIAGNDMEGGERQSEDEEESDFEGDAKTGEKEGNQFNLIIGFIIKLLPREKLSELLVDKMCQRFKIVSSSARQCRNLGFVLSLLHYNDKAFNKLQEHLPTYAPVLRNNKALLHYFHVVIENCKKNCKPELKPTISDLEASMECAFRGEDTESGKENDENNENFPESPAQRRSKKTSAAASEVTPRASRATARVTAAGSSKETPALAASPMSRRENVKSKKKGGGKVTERASKAKSSRRRVAMLDSSASSLEQDSILEEQEEESSLSDEDRRETREVDNKSTLRRSKNTKAAFNDSNASASSSPSNMDKSILRRSMRNMTLSPLVESKRSRRK